jgi:hypothetical protein
MLKGAREPAIKPIQLNYCLIKKVLANKCGPTNPKHGILSLTNPALLASDWFYIWGSCLRVQAYPATLLLLPCFSKEQYPDDSCISNDFQAL